MKYDHDFWCYLSLEQFESLTAQANSFRLSKSAYCRLLIDSKLSISNKLIESSSKHSQKSKYLSIKLTELQKLTLRELAKIHGLSMAKYLCCLIELSPDITDCTKLPFDPSSYPAPTLLYTRGELSALLRELRKQGINLNQAVKGINTLAKEGHTFNYSDMKFWTEDIKHLLNEVLNAMDFTKKKLKQLPKRTVFEIDDYKSTDISEC